jgi:hypothetical protein
MAAVGLSFAGLLQSSHDLGRRPADLVCSKRAQQPLNPAPPLLAIIKQHSEPDESRAGSALGYAFHHPLREPNTPHSERGLERTHARLQNSEDYVGMR